MGARQSKRSVDITTTPKKEGAEEQQQPLDGRLGHIEEGSGDTKPAANGAPSHSATDIQEEVMHNGSEQIVDGEIETAHTPEGESAIAEEKEKSPTEETNADNKAKKDKKDKVKKKWSFRSISFSKKDKSKPTREDKNGDVTKEEVAEGSEEKVETTESSAPTEATEPVPQQEPATDVVKDSEPEEKKEEVIAAEVETKTELVATEATNITKVEELPVQVEEPKKEQPPPASESEPAASVPSVEEVPPPLPASPPPTDVEAPPIAEPVPEVKAATQESTPVQSVESKDSVEVPDIEVQPASPILATKEEKNTFTQQEITTAPVESPKTEESAEVSPAPESQTPPAPVEEKTEAPVEEKTEALVEEKIESPIQEKTEAPVDATMQDAEQPVPSAIRVEEQVVESVPAPIETPAQVEPEPVQASDIKAPETQESVQASTETADSTTAQTAVEE